MRCRAPLRPTARLIVASSTAAKCDCVPRNIDDGRPIRSIVTQGLHRIGAGGAPRWFRRETHDHPSRGSGEPAGRDRLTTRPPSRLACPSSCAPRIPLLLRHLLKRSIDGRLRLFLQTVMMHLADAIASRKSRSVYSCLHSIICTRAPSENYVRLPIK
jgi:hypothetical protein